MNAGERRAAARRSAPPRRSPVTIDAARAPTAALPSLFSPFRGDRETPASASPPSGRSGGRIAAPRLDRLCIPVLIAGYWARSSAGERSSHTREAAGSNPAAPTIGCARTPGAKPFRLSPRNACGRLRRWMQRRPVPSSRLRRASRLYLRRPGRQGRPTLSTHPPARHAGNLRREGWTNRRGVVVVASAARRLSRFWFPAVTVETGEDPPAKRDGATVGIAAPATRSDGITWR